MTTEAIGTFAVTSWNEETEADRPIGRLTRATVTATLTGSLEGTARVTWLMCYRADGTADYVGLLDVDATLDGRAGGFVVRTTGEFDGTRATGPWAVVAGSGRGALEGIRGVGAFESPHGAEATYRLDWDIA